jgi:hypothetical protein
MEIAANRFRHLHHNRPWFDRLDLAGRDTRYRCRSRHPTPGRCLWSVSAAGIHHSVMLEEAPAWDALDLLSGSRGSTCRHISAALPFLRKSQRVARWSRHCSRIRGVFVSCREDCSGEASLRYGEPGRNRTCDPRIKSALLYQLSYGPALLNLTQLKPVPRPCT